MDLLETLSELLECQYLSDLSHAVANAEQKEQILHLSEQNYSLETYQEAARYITGKSDLCCKTAAEAKMAIIEHLSGRV